MLNVIISNLPLINEDKSIPLTSTPLLFSKIKSVPDNVPPVTKVSVIPVTKPQTSNVVPLLVVNVTHPFEGLYVPPVTLTSLSLNNAAELVTLNVPPVVFVNDSCCVTELALPLETKTSTTLPVYELKILVSNLSSICVCTSPL